MVEPTHQNLSEIIEKLKILKRRETDFMRRKFSKLSANTIAKSLTDEHAKTLDYGPSIEELIRSAVDDGSGRLLSRTEESDDDSIALLVYGNTEELRRRIIPTLPVQELRRLLNEFVPHLKEGGLSALEEQKLQQIESVLKYRLEERERYISSQESRLNEFFSNWKEVEIDRPKESTYWPPGIRALMDEIDTLIFPYWDYLKENSSWKESGRTYIVYPVLLTWVQMGAPSALDRVIHELEKVRHKMELEVGQKQAPARKIGLVDSISELYTKKDLKRERIRKWAEDLIKRDPANVPRGFNELLRLAKEEFGECGVPTLRKAIEESPTLQDWDKKTKQWSANKKLAKAQPNSLDERMQPAADKDKTGHLYALQNPTVLSPEEDADTNERMEKLCSMPVEKLLKKVKGTFVHWIKWTDDVNGGRKRDPNKEWEELRQEDPSSDVSNKESLARLQVALEGQISEILRHDPKAQSDPMKRKYLREPGL